MALSAGGVLACVLSTFAFTASPSTASPAVISSGEVEVASISLTSDALALRLRESAPGGAAQDPANVVLQAGSETVTAVPEAPEWSFLGKPGQRVWLFSESDGASGIHPAWDTTGIQSGQLVDDTVQWRLVKATGPGDFSAFRAQLFGKPTVVFDSAHGRDRYDLPVGNRDRTTWAFNAAGRYELTFAAAGTLASGKQISNEAKYVVDVVDAAPTTPAPFPTAPTGPTSSPTDRDATPAVTAEQATAEQAPAALPAQANPGDTATGRVVLDKGHVDAVAPRFVNGAFQIQIKDSTTGPVIWRRVSDVVFHVKPAAELTVPNDRRFSFIGKPGDKVWMIPQTQNPAVIWAGWDTEELKKTTMSGNITWTLAKVEGPGKLALFMNTQFGDPTVIFDTDKPLPITTDVALETHVHGNWVFTKEGVYRLTFEMSGKRVSGDAVSDRKTYTFAVGNVDPTKVTPVDNENPTTTPTTTSTTTPGATTSATTSTNPGGGNPDGGNSNGANPGGGRLAYTGVANIVPLAAGGVGLIAVGAVLYWLSRRRSRQANTHGEGTN